MPSWRVVTLLALMGVLAGGERAAGAVDADVPPNEEAGPPAAVEAAVETDAEGAEAAESPADLAELERRIAVLAEEVEKLRSGEAADSGGTTPEQARALGLAPSAASLYRKRRGVSIAGYGEMLYEDVAREDESGQPTGAAARLDFLRAIVYTGYRFSDEFLFNSEIELEHADEASVEFAYVEYLPKPSLGVRAGMLLLPLGLVNEFHEPTVFLGARRPETETRLIPSTWRENGIGVHGTAGRLAFRAYLVNGLDARGFSASGLRGGRQKGAKALAEDLAVAARLDFTPVPGLLLGASAYSGGSGQGQVQQDSRSLEVGTTVFDLHGLLQMRGLDLRGLWARAELDDAGSLNRALGLSETAGVAEVLQGGYLQLGYDVLSQVDSGDAALTLYYRYERLDTQAEMPAGFERDPAMRLTLNTFGLELKPVPGVVLKADYQITGNDAGTGRNQFNVALGYAF